MENWKKIGFYADGVVYACGDKRKIERPCCPDIYLDLGKNKIWWHPNSGNNRLVESGKDK